ncbi:MAG: oxygen-independent coproporphyrinogen III oxidase [Bacteroidota bacterium]
MLIPRDLLEKYNTAVPRYTSYPPANFFEQEDKPVDVVTLLEDSNQQPTQNISIYLHIPFCPKQCFYCGCNTTITRNRDKIHDYVQALKQEIRQTARHINNNRNVTQVHWGGGTPNYLDADRISEIMQLLRTEFTFADNPEIAIECNPAYLDKKYVDALINEGFNRFSLGIQDFNEKVLKTVNREPSAMPVKELSDYIRRDGKAAVNLDFIYGLPYQDEQAFRDTIEKAIAIRPDRLVTFSYAHVPWFKKAQKKLEEHGLPEAEQKLRLFELAYQMLTEAGYIPIGLDHFAKPDDELAIALKNKKLHRNFQGYCTRETTGQVYAFGTSAISQLDRAYYQNTKDVDKYTSKIHEGESVVEKVYRISDQEAALREVINEVMCNRQLPWNEIGRRVGMPEKEIRKMTAITPEKLLEFEQDELIKNNPEKLEVTDKGRFFIRNIAAAFDPLVQQTDKKFSKSI